MSDSDDMSLPVPSRGRGSGSLMGQGSVTGGLFSGLKASGRGALASTLGAGRTGGGAGAGGLTGDRGSRRLIMTGSRQGSRQSSWKTSNGSNNGARVEKVGGEKVCMACGIQFTWRLRRHHCRACKKVRVLWGALDDLVSRRERGGDWFALVWAFDCAGGVLSGRG